MVSIDGVLLSCKDIASCFAAADASLLHLSSYAFLPASGGFMVLVEIDLLLVLV